MIKNFLLILLICPFSLLTSQELLLPQYPKDQVLKIRTENKDSRSKSYDDVFFRIFIADVIENSYNVQFANYNKNQIIDSTVAVFKRYPRMNRWLKDLKTTIYHADLDVEIPISATTSKKVGQVNFGHELINEIVSLEFLKLKKNTGYNKAMRDAYYAGSLILAAEVNHNIDSYRLGKDAQSAFESVDLSKIDTTLQSVVHGYFKYLPRRIRRKILINYLLNVEPIQPSLRGDTTLMKAKNTQILKEIVKGSGPIMQKLGQTIIHDLDEGKEKEELQFLMSKGPVFNNKDIMNSLLEVEKVSGFMGIKPMGKAGTIAQAHKVYVNKDSIVVKIKKPDLDQIIMEELTIVDSLNRNELVNNPYAKRFIRDIKDVIIKDADLESEMKATILAKGYYDTGLIYVPSILHGLPNGTEHFAIEYIDAISWDSLHLYNMNPQKEIDYLQKEKEWILEIQRLWFRNVVGETGFFHGDLHGGNILVDPSNSSKPVIIIDFGSVGQFDQTQRYALIDFLQNSATKTEIGNNLDIIVDNFIDLKVIGSDQQSECLDSLERVVQEYKDDATVDDSKFRKKIAGAAYSLGSTEDGITLLAFLRGKNFIDQHIENVNSLIKLDHDKINPDQQYREIIEDIIKQHWLRLGIIVSGFFSVLVCVIWICNREANGSHKVSL